MKYLMQKITHLLFADGLRKITALVLAVIVYAAIYSSEQLETKTIPDVVIEVQSSDGLIVDPMLKQNPLKANIIVSGNQKALDNLSASDFQGDITVSDKDYSSPGVYKVPISAKTFSVRNELLHVQVTGVRDKSFVFVNAHHWDRRNRDIEIKVTGKLSPDFKLGNVSWEPRQLQLEGPEDIVSNLKILTPEIQLTPEIIASFDRVVEATTDAPPGQVREPGRPEEKNISVPIKVTVEIAAADPIAAEIPNLDIKIKKDPANLYIIETNIQKATLSIIGAPSQVEALKLDPSNIEVYADIGAVAAKPGTHSVPLRFSLPKDGVTGQKITPERVNVTVSEPKKHFL